MNLKNYITIVFLSASIFCIAQKKVCENTENEFVDLNTIGKCSIENFKKSNNKEYVKIATRNRYVRKRNNRYINNLKKNLKSIASVAPSAPIATNTVTPKKTEVVADKDAVIKNFVRFDKVTQAPVFINCADYNMHEKQACAKETIVHNITENLTYPFDAAAEGIEGVVWVRFIVDTNGYVKNISTKGPENGALLEKEAERLINLLPKFIPGKYNNDYVNVEYFMPIDFQLDE